jgi:hypothetical protein
LGWGNRKVKNEKGKGRKEKGGMKEIEDKHSTEDWRKGGQ